MGVIIDLFEGFQGPARLRDGALAGVTDGSAEADPGSMLSHSNLENSSAGTPADPAKPSPAHE